MGSFGDARRVCRPALLVLCSGSAVSALERGFGCTRGTCTGFSGLVHGIGLAGELASPSQRGRRRRVLGSVSVKSTGLSSLFGGLIRC